MIRNLFFMFVLCVLSFSAWASKNFIETPEFYKEHLNKGHYEIDTSASAVVLYESAVYSIDKDIHDEYYTTCRIRKIIKILKKGGVEESNVRIVIENSEHFYGGITKVKAATYNLHNGAVVKQEMPDNSIKIEKGSESFSIGKFSLPSVSVGSIIDYTYETKEEFSNMIAVWEIQESLPKLVSEITLYYPDFIKLALITQNLPEFKEFDDSKDVNNSIQSYYTPTVIPSGGAYSKRWVRKNIPAAIDEPYLYNVRNYSERITFRVASSRTTTNVGRYLVTHNTGLMNWPHLNKRLMENKSFFGQLRNERYLPARQFLERIGEDVPDKLEYARKIYNYIRDSFSYKNESTIYTAREIDWILKNRSGNHLDFHLALIAALREAGIKAYPVVLSTRDNFKLLDDYPNLQNLNYVITRLSLNGQEYYLDPTKKYYPFNTISPLCYNGFAWVVNDTGLGILMDPAVLKERMVIQVKTLSNDEKDYRLSIRKVYGRYDASDKRKEWIEDSLKVKKDILEETKSLGLDVRFQSYNVFNLMDPDTNLIVEYIVKVDFPSDKTFFIPSLFNYYTDVPFKSERRYNPVEFPYSTDINYSLNLKLPDGYTLEEVPVSGVLKYDEEDYYKYLIDFDKESNTLMLNTKLNFQRVFFAPEEYKDLRSYFDRIIETQQKAVIIKRNS